MTSSKPSVEYKLDEFYFLDLSKESTRNAIRRATANVPYVVPVRLIADPTGPIQTATAKLSDDGDEVVIETKTGNGYVQHHRSLKELLIDISSIEKFS